MADVKETKYPDKEAMKKYKEELRKKRKPRPLSNETIDVLNEYDGDLLPEQDADNKEAALPRD